MIDGIRIKVCGLTSLVDAEFADAVGADFIAFNLYPKSPRFLPLVQFQAMAKRLPPRRKVAVLVEPSVDELTAARDAGFDFFQIHFRHDLALETIAAWSAAVGPEKLWLAPKLPPAVDVAAEWLPLADTFLIDTFHAGGFGGSGQAGDWGKFARMQAADGGRGKTWILAGGLNPANIGDALASSGARFVDVNSGVEVAPGVKDQTKLKAFVVAVHKARTAGT